MSTIEPMVWKIGSKALADIFYVDSCSDCGSDFDSVSAVVIQGLLDAGYTISKKRGSNFIDDQTFESVLNMVLSLEHELIEIKGPCGNNCKLHKGHSGNCLIKRN